MTHTFSTQVRRAVALTVATAALPMLGGRPANAHVHATPERVKPGANATVVFGIGHGCGTSATTSVAIKVPATVTNVVAVAPKGWTASISKSVVTFSGGKLADKTKGSFGVRFVAPATTGVLLFPTVQTCLTGKNSWTQAPLTNGKEPENPAPFVIVTNTSATAKATSP